LSIRSISFRGGKNGCELEKYWKNASMHRCRNFVPLVLELWPVRFQFLLTTWKCSDEGAVSCDNP
jgi:hypothetical protein